MKLMLFIRPRVSIHDLWLASVAAAAAVVFVLVSHVVGGEDRPSPDQRPDFAAAVSPPGRVPVEERLQAVPSLAGVPPSQAAGRPRRDPEGSRRGAALRLLRRLGAAEALRLRGVRRSVVPHAAWTLPRGGARRVDAAGA